MPLLDAAEITVKRSKLLKIMAQVSSMWAKGCMLADCVCVIHQGGVVMSSQITHTHNHPTYTL